MRQTPNTQRPMLPRRPLGTKGARRPRSPDAPNAKAEMRADADGPKADRKALDAQCAKVTKRP